MFFSLLQLFLSYGKFGELKYGEEPFTEEHIRTVFELLPELDEGLAVPVRQRAGVEDGEYHPHPLLGAGPGELWRPSSASTRRIRPPEIGGSVFSKLEQELSGLTGGVPPAAKGDTAPISGGPGPGSPSPRREEETQALAKQAGGGGNPSQKGCRPLHGEKSDRLRKPAKRIPLSKR